MQLESCVIFRSLSHTCMIKRRQAQHEVGLKLLSKVAVTLLHLWGTCLILPWPAVCRAPPACSMQSQRFGVLGYSTCKHADRAYASGHPMILTRPLQAVPCALMKLVPCSR